MAGTGFAETTPYGNLECGRAKSGRRDLMGSQRVARPSFSTRRRHRGKGRKRQKTPSPPYNVPHIQASAGRVAFYYFVFLKRRKCIRGHFFGVFGIRSGLHKGSPASAGASAGIRACVGRYVNQNGCFSGPCLATLLPSRNRKGL